jgi:integrase
MRPLLRKSEFRFSLGTTDRQIACYRAQVLVPYVYAIRRLARIMAALSQTDVERALRRALNSLVEDLERSKEPWFAHDPLKELLRLDKLQRPAVAVLDGKDVRDLAPRLARLRASTSISQLQQDIRQRNFAEVAPNARKLLEAVGVDAPEPSPEFSSLCEELLKLEAIRYQVDIDRQNGEFETEHRYLASYMRRGLLGSPEHHQAAYAAPAVAPPPTPRLSEAWAQYVREKTAVRGTSRWRPKTAGTQQTTFDEFLEIVGDMPVGVVTRDFVGRYLDVASRLPKNRRLRFPDKTIAELSREEFPPGDRLSARTLAERLIHLGAFFKWCRESRGFLATNPTAGFDLDASSQSYAPFTATDLRALFLSAEYQTNQHRKSWQFWAPLIALYSGARLGEIVQLRTDNIVQEDGIWLIVITDEAEDQQVKTRARVRKVPVSRKLMDLGFIEYADALRSKAQVKLFGDLPGGAPSRQRNRVSRWFNEDYKRRCRVQGDPTGARKVFHSFRHTAITKAVTAALPIAHCQQVFGHEKSMMGETATYTHEIQPSVLAVVIAALDFGLDHSQYRQAWEAYV